MKKSVRLGSTTADSVSTPVTSAPLGPTQAQPIISSTSASPPLRQDLHRSVHVVPHPSDEIELASRLPAGLAVAHSLHVTAHHRPDGLHRTGWHAGQKWVDRARTTTRAIGLPQPRHGSSVRP